MKNKIYFILISLIGVFPVPASAKYYVGHCRNYPPDLYFENAKCTGVVADLVSDIFADLGLKIKWQKVPWGRSLIDAQKERLIY